MCPADRESVWMAPISGAAAGSIFVEVFLDAVEKAELLPKLDTSHTKTRNVRHANTGARNEHSRLPLPRPGRAGLRSSTFLVLWTG